MDNLYDPLRQEKEEKKRNFILKKFRNPPDPNLMVTVDLPKGRQPKSQRTPEQQEIINKLNSSLGIREELNVPSISVPQEDIMIPEIYPEPKPTFGQEVSKAGQNIYEMAKGEVSALGETLTNWYKDDNEEKRYQAMYKYLDWYCSQEYGVADIDELKVSKNSLYRGLVGRFKIWEEDRHAFYDDIVGELILPEEEGKRAFSIFGTLDPKIKLRKFDEKTQNSITRQLKEEGYTREDIKTSPKLKNLLNAYAEVYSKKIEKEEEEKTKITPSKILKGFVKGVQEGGITGPLTKVIGEVEEQELDPMINFVLDTTGMAITDLAEFAIAGGLTKAIGTGLVKAGIKIAPKAIPHIKRAAEILGKTKAMEILKRTKTKPVIFLKGAIEGAIKEAPVGVTYATMKEMSEFISNTPDGEPFLDKLKQDTAMFAAFGATFRSLSRLNQFNKINKEGWLGLEKEIGRVSKKMQISKAKAIKIAVENIEKKAKGIVKDYGEPLKTEIEVKKELDLAERIYTPEPTSQMEYYKKMIEEAKGVLKDIKTDKQQKTRKINVIIEEMNIKDPVKQRLKKNIQELIKIDEPFETWASDIGEKIIKKEGKLLKEIPIEAKEKIYDKFQRSLEETDLTILNKNKAIKTIKRVIEKTNKATEPVLLKELDKMTLKMKDLSTRSIGENLKILMEKGSVLNKLKDLVVGEKGAIEIKDILKKVGEIEADTVKELKIKLKEKGILKEGKVNIPVEPDKIRPVDIEYEFGEIGERKITKAELQDIKRGYQPPETIIQSVKTFVKDLFRTKQFQAETSIPDKIIYEAANEFKEIIAENCSNLLTNKKMELYNYKKWHTDKKKLLNSIIKKSDKLNDKLNEKNFLKIKNTDKEMYEIYDSVSKDYQTVAKRYIENFKRQLDTMEEKSVKSELYNKTFKRFSRILGIVKNTKYAVPRLRKGDYQIVIRDTKGTVVIRKHFETPKEQTAYIDQLKRDKKVKIETKIKDKSGKQSIKISDMRITDFSKQVHIPFVHKHKYDFVDTLIQSKGKMGELKSSLYDLISGRADVSKECGVIVHDAFNFLREYHEVADMKIKTRSKRLIGGYETGKELENSLSGLIQMNVHNSTIDIMHNVFKYLDNVKEAGKQLYPNDVRLQNSISKFHEHTIDYITKIAKGNKSDLINITSQAITAKFIGFKFNSAVANPITSFVTAKPSINIILNRLSLKPLPSTYMSDLFMSGLDSIQYLLKKQITRQGGLSVRQLKILNKVFKEKAIARKVFAGRVEMVKSRTQVEKFMQGLKNIRDFKKIPKDLFNEYLNMSMKMFEKAEYIARGGVYLDIARRMIKSGTTNIQKIHKFSLEGANRVNFDMSKTNLPRLIANNKTLIEMYKFQMFSIGWSNLVYNELVGKGIKGAPGAIKHYMRYMIGGGLSSTIPLYMWLWRASKTGQKITERDFKQDPYLKFLNKVNEVPVIGQILYSGIGSLGAGVSNPTLTYGLPGPGEVLNGVGSVYMEVIEDIVDVRRNYKKDNIEGVIKGTVILLAPNIINRMWGKLFNKTDWITKTPQKLTIKGSLITAMGLKTKKDLEKWHVYNLSKYIYSKLDDEQKEIIQSQQNVTAILMKNYDITGKESKPQLPAEYYGADKETKQKIKKEFNRNLNNFYKYLTNKGLRKIERKMKRATKE